MFNESRCSGMYIMIGKTFIARCLYGANLESILSGYGIYIQVQLGMPWPFAKNTPLFFFCHNSIKLLVLGFLGEFCSILVSLGLGFFA